MQPTNFTEANDKIRGFQKKTKNQRKSKRKAVGYDDRELQMCRNCAHFLGALFHKPTNERFPARCKLNQFEVKPIAICNLWEA